MRPRRRRLPHRRIAAAALSLRVRRAALVALASLPMLAGAVLGAQPARSQTPAAERCGDKRVVTARIRCLLDAAEAAEDPGLCEAAGEPAVRFNCLALYAEHRRDPAPCVRIAGDDKEARTLRESCIAGVAVARGDPSLCERATLPATRDACLMMVVTRAGADPALCAEIANPAIRDSCAQR